MTDNDYKTIEQKAWDSVGSNILDFGSNIIKGAYGAVATPFRIPTLLRRLEENTTLLERIDKSSEDYNKGVLIGFGLASPLFIFPPTLLIINAKEGNYAPAIITASVLAGTNLFSGVYEAVRKAKKNDLEQAVKVKGIEE